MLVPRSTEIDLLTPSAPGRNMTSPDQEQGKQTAQQQSMRILPIGTPPVANAPAGPAPAPVAAPAPATPAAPSAPGPLPGELPWLDHPGSGGPPTTGLPNSAGPGPEALTGLGAQWHAQQQSEQGTLQQLLGHLAAQPAASSLTKTLASAAGHS